VVENPQKAVQGDHFLLSDSSDRCPRSHCCMGHVRHVIFVAREKVPWSHCPPFSFYFAPKHFASSPLSLQNGFRVGGTDRYHQHLGLHWHHLPLLCPRSQQGVSCLLNWRGQLLTKLFQGDSMLPDANRSNMLAVVSTGHLPNHFE